MTKINEKFAAGFENLVSEAAVFFDRRGELKSNNELSLMTDEELRDYSVRLIFKKFEVQRYEALASRKRSLIGAGYADKAINMPSEGAGLFGSVFSVDYLSPEALDEIEGSTYVYGEDEDYLRVAYAWANNREHAEELLSGYLGFVGEVSSDGTVEVDEF
ncbi:hypothetical protein [Geomicrobium sediminis]|uniref:Phage portal protein n=1 Tax=Geomicrobium sediminis TaxID=1347788 RepID=A0ABS2PIL4_9BACL|nr:hypothetical protein [Geomicrobium sediminis]MBM7634936.1 hypothetical protein [Geomicrobium sediminis]